MMPDFGESAGTLGAVLCGGGSRRFGSPKWDAPLDGVRLLDRALACQRRAFGDVIIVAARNFTGAGEGVTVVHDEWEDRGPATGIHAALGEAQRRGLEGVWCLPCDAPFANPELGRRLAARAFDGAGAVFPASHGPLGFEPLFGWYRTTCRDVLARLLADGSPSMSMVARALSRTELLSLEEVEAISPAELQFLNVNTPEDMALAERYLPQSRS